MSKGIRAKVIAASQFYSTRLTTLVVTMPRCILSEFNTHRALSRNSASSRARPVARMIEEVRSNPYVPSRFSINRSGMSASEFVYPGEEGWGEPYRWWTYSIDQAIDRAVEGAELGLHKQVVNRILEPYMMHTVIVSATEWDNFFNLRLATDDQGNPLADIAIYDTALKMKEALDNSQYSELKEGQWHVPFSLEQDQEFSEYDRLLIAAARCARVSYINPEDYTNDPEKDLKLARRLIDSKHLSPFEHIAKAVHHVVHNNFNNSFYQLRRVYE